MGQTLRGPGVVRSHRATSAVVMPSRRRPLAHDREKGMLNRWGACDERRDCPTTLLSPLGPGLPVHRPTYSALHSDIAFTSSHGFDRWTWASTWSISDVGT